MSKASPFNSVSSVLPDEDSNLSDHFSSEDIGSDEEHSLFSNDGEEEEEEDLEYDFDEVASITKNKDSRTSSPPSLLTRKVQS